MPVYRQPYPPRSPSAGGRYRMARPTTYDALMGAPSPDNITQISDADYATAGAAGPPPAWGAGALPRGKPPKPAVQPAPGGAGAVDPRIHAMDSMSDYWRNLSKKFKPAAGGTTPQQSGAAAMLQGQSPPATPQLGATPQFAPQRTVSPETEASVNTMLRPPLNPVAAQYLAGTPMAGATTASEVPRLREQNEAARNQGAILSTPKYLGGQGLPSMSATQLGLDLRSPQEKASANVAAYYAQPGRVEGPGGPAATMLAGMEARPATPVPPEWREEMSRRNASRRLMGLGEAVNAGTARGDVPYDLETQRRIIQDRLLGKESAWLNASTSPGTPNTPATSTRSPTTGRTREQIKTERQGELAKRATRSEYRKTGQRVEPGTIAARQLLESYMPQGLIPGDLPLAAMAGGPQGSPWRNAAEALAPMGPMQAMEKDKELDRGLKREEMASREIAAGLQGQSPQTSELIQQRKAGQTQQPATSIRPRGVAPQNEVAPGKTNELAVAAYMKALGDPATAAAALAAGISKEQAAQNTVAKEHGPAAAQAAAQAVHGQAIEEANKPFWNPDTSTFWPGRNPETGKVWERPFLRAPLDPLLHIIRSLSGA